MDQPPLFDDIGEPLKRCRACGQLKPHGEFHRKRNSKDGIQGRCKLCNIESAKRFHAENTEHCRDRIRERASRLRRAEKLRLLQYLFGAECIDCGERNPLLLEFDHLRDKTMEVAEMANRGLPWSVILAEIEKCDVVCANCHRMRTYERANTFRVATLHALVDTLCGLLWAASGSNREPTL